MSAESRDYRPDYGVPPGRLLDEYLDGLGISAREFSRRCGRSAKLIVEIIAGKAPIEPETAMQFERVLGMEADVWLAMEAHYRLRLAEAEDEKKLAKQAPWARRFPLAELRRRGAIGHAGDAADDVRQLLIFFGVGSVEACRQRFEDMATVSFRHSPSYDSHEESLMAWLRLGEMAAAEINCLDYNRAKFLDVLREARTLTLKPLAEALPLLTAACAQAGVAFVIVRALPDIALSGISRWLSPRKALIQQSLRHLANDHFWFTFFHEAAHLLLHSRKTVFLDGNGFGGQGPEEDEANQWAANFLIPQVALQRFIASFGGTQAEVVAFAADQGIAPGLVIGQLQNAGVLTFAQMSKLKERYKWVE
ncbi:HigA family addiction module antitoxin [Methylobacterium sp. A52T]